MCYSFFKLLEDFFKRRKKTQMSFCFDCERANLKLNFKLLLLSLSSLKLHLELRCYESELVDAILIQNDLILMIFKQSFLFQIIINQQVLREILIHGPLDLVVDVHSEVLSEDLRLIILIGVVFRLVVFCAGSRLVFITDKKFVEDL